MGGATLRLVSPAEAFRARPLLGTLLALVFCNWFVGVAVSAFLGGDALGILPSVDGFVVTSHGHRTAVGERAWLFSLIYMYLTLTLSPLVVFLWVRPLVELPKGVVRWFLLAFIGIWCAAWFGSISSSFLRSLHDWLTLRVL